MLEYEKPARLESTFDPYPRKSRVQDLNLLKSDFGSENACVKDKMRMFKFFKATSLRSAALFKIYNLGFGGTNRMNPTLAIGAAV